MEEVTKNASAIIKTAPLKGQAGFHQVSTDMSGFLKLKISSGDVIILSYT